MSRVRLLERLAACFNAFSAGKGGGLPWPPPPGRGTLACAAQCAQARPFAAVSKDEVLTLVKELRSQTGAPIGDVRAALKEADFNLENAFDALRKRGAAAAAKKSTREALQVLQHGFQRFIVVSRIYPGPIFPAMFQPDPWGPLPTDTTRLRHREPLPRSNSIK